MDLLMIPDWALLLFITLLLLHCYSMRNYDWFKKIGIPGPRPLPLVGTTLGIVGKSVMEYDRELHAKYGKFVGTFEGVNPVLLVADPDWLKEAFIKNFSFTMDRKPMLFGGEFDDGIFTGEGEHWKHVRSELSPAFTSGKLKMMVPTIAGCSDTFTSKMKRLSGEPVDVRKHLVMLTTDVISKAAFGVDLDPQEDPDSPAAKYALVIASQGESDGGILSAMKLATILFIFFFLPKGLAKVLDRVLGLCMLDKGAVRFFTELSKKVLTCRVTEVESSSRTHDFIQLLLDRKVDIDKEEEDSEINCLGYKWTRKGLTERDVVGNALIFFLAGFTTTADTLMFLLFELAHSQDIQQQLFEELEEVCLTDEITYEQLQRLKFLECCINETMRIYPQSLRYDRIASEDFTVKGVTVRKGTILSASGYTLHMDPEVWNDPQSFDPERFLPHRLPCGIPAGFTPFGMGNRACIGNRFAMIQMKIAAASILKNFIVETCAQTPIRPLKFKCSINIYTEELIKVSFISREF